MDAGHIVTFTFHRLDLPEVSRVFVSTIPRGQFGREFRRLHALHPIVCVGFDARRHDNPAVLAEKAAFQQTLRGLFSQA